MTIIRSYFRPEFKRRLMRGEVPDWLAKHKRKQYIISAVLSFPPWAPRDELKALERESARRSKITGIPHSLDHVVPLNHPLVCGLSVPWNLEITTSHSNSRKGNAWDEREGHEQLELFKKDFVEQFELPL